MPTTFYNRATLSYDGQTLASNTVTGEIADSLAVTKTALTPTYTVGSDMGYAVSIVNNGTTDINNITLTDDLGAYSFGTPEQTLTPLTYTVGSVKFFIDGELQPAPTVTAGPPLTVTGISVPAGGNAMIVYETVPNEYAVPDGGTINNTVTASGPEITTPAEAAATVISAEGPVLSIIKSLNPTVVSENGQLTYTFTIENTGNTATTGDVIINDTLTPVLSDISVTLDGRPLAANDLTYDTTTGEFSTGSGVITVPAATYEQDPATGVWVVTPGVTTVTVTGTV